MIFASFGGKLAERLGGFGGDSERLDLFLSLLLGLMKRLIRTAANGEGAIGEEASLARRLLDGQLRTELHDRFSTPFYPLAMFAICCVLIFFVDFIEMLRRAGNNPGTTARGFPLGTGTDL